MKYALPEKDAIEHSQKLIHSIADKIQHSGGAISFADYMEHVLYAPGLGYYSAGCTKIGEHGDFITAPEISSLFSRCIARAVSPVLQHLPIANLLEVGAGSGTMAADILNELAAMDIAIEAYYILERSAELRERQQQTIAQNAPTLINKVQWLDSLPTSFCGVIVANELLDAMPIHLFKKKENRVFERHVMFEDGKFSWKEIVSTNSRLTARVSKIESSLENLFQENYQSEVNFAAEDWLSSINAILEKGYILLLDYGYSEKEYYHEQRSQGTLSCFYQHGRHDDPFLFPGLQDITAHIDFTNLTETALKSSPNTGVATLPSLQLNGYTNQSQFLMASGIMEMVQENSDNNDQNIKQQLILSQQVKKLTMPYEMGETVKVIGFEKGLSEHSNFDLPCFSMRDLRYQL
ncbi:MAG: class I SAM-dependent methyltransferase [Gammaproteobacteria bacterium]